MLHGRQNPLKMSCQGPKRHLLDTRCHCQSRSCTCPHDWVIPGGFSGFEEHYLHFDIHPGMHESPLNCSCGRQQSQSMFHAADSTAHMQESPSQAPRKDQQSPQSHDAAATELNVYRLRNHIVMIVKPMSSRAHPRQRWCRRYRTITQMISLTL